MKEIVTNNLTDQPVTGSKQLLVIKTTKHQCDQKFSLSKMYSSRSLPIPEKNMYSPYLPRQLPTVLCHEINTFSPTPSIKHNLDNNKLSLTRFSLLIDNKVSKIPTNPYQQHSKSQTLSMNKESLNRQEYLYTTNKSLSAKVFIITPSNNIIC